MPPYKQSGVTPTSQGFGANPILSLLQGVHEGKQEEQQRLAQEQKEAQDRAIMQRLQEAQIARQEIGADLDREKLTDVRDERVRRQEEADRQQETLEAHKTLEGARLGQVRDAFPDMTDDELAEMEHALATGATDVVDEIWGRRQQQQQNERQNAAAMLARMQIEDRQRERELQEQADAMMADPAFRAMARQGEQYNRADLKQTFFDVWVDRGNEPEAVQAAWQTVAGQGPDMRPDRQPVVTGDPGRAAQTTAHEFIQEAAADGMDPTQALQMFRNAAPALIEQNQMTVEEANEIAAEMQAEILRQSRGETRGGAAGAAADAMERIGGGG